MHFYLLAGGRSSRMGQNKALMRIDGQPLITRVLDVIPAAVSNTFIITNAPVEYRFLPQKKIKDIRPGLGPISGIHAGLCHSPFQHNFFVACDLPFLTRENITALTSRHHDQDLLGYRTEKRFQPLCAIYAKRCLSHLEQKMMDGDYSLQDMPERVNSELLVSDAVEIWFNMNEKQDHERAIARIRQTQSG
jgi:molybdopterin-guanine dinucleotide biosynthesis protein A